MSSGQNNSFNPFIKLPDNPNALWTAEEINNEQSRINNYVNTNITSSLLTSNTAQTVSGNKEFEYLILTGSSVPSYNSVMSSLNYDISPLSGNGYPAIVNSSNPTEAEIKKLAFLEANCSGVKSPISYNNPIFLKSNIVIESIDNSNITVEAYNVPLSAYDINKSGTPPNSLPKADAKFWNTSVSYSGTINKSSFIGGLETTTSAIAGYFICLAKKDTSLTADCLVVKYGSEGLIDSEYKSFKKIGFLCTKGTGASALIFSFTITNNKYLPIYDKNGFNLGLTLDNTDLGNGTSGTINIIGLSTLIRASCIAKVRLGNSYTGNIYIDGNTFYSGTSGTFRLDDVNIPFVWDGTRFYNVTQDLSTTVLLLLKEVIFGSLQ